MTKLTFGDTDAKRAMQRYEREKEKFEKAIAAAKPLLLSMAASTGRSISSLAEDRNMVREFGADVMREASRRLREEIYSPLNDDAEHAE